MTGHEPVIIMSQASKGIEYTSWLEPLSCILNVGTVWTDSTTTRLYYTWIYAPLWQGIITCSFAERKNMRQWAQTLTIKGFTRYSFTIQFQLLSGRPASRQDRSAQESCSVHIRTCARAYIYSWNIEKKIWFFIFWKAFFYHLIGMNYIFFAIQCLCVSISFNVLLFHNSVGVTCLLLSSKHCTVTDNTRDGYNKPLTAAFSCVPMCWKHSAENTGNGICETLYLGIFFGGGASPQTPLG